MHLSLTALWGIALSLVVTFGGTAKATDPDISTFFTLYQAVAAEFEANQAVSIVRMAFHDSWGGVDGRLNQADAEHNGLIDNLNQIENLYNRDNLGLGRSDFFAWVYVAAFYSCMPLDFDAPWVELTYGRADVDDGAAEDVPPGSAFGTLDHTSVLTYFSDNFGFSASETATILGGHTLGSAFPQNSGFTGDWTSTPTTFNTEYYEVMVQPPQGRWKQIEISAGKHEWRWGCDAANQGCQDLMLNVDMDLFFDITYDSTGKAILPAGSSCSSDQILDTCFPQRGGDTGDIVSSFATGGDFANQFAPVFARMINRVKTASTLTSIPEPNGWPNDVDVGEAGSFCFSGSTMVHVANKGLVQMKDVRVGDSVWSGNSKFEPVYAFGHRHEKEPAEFLQIHVIGTDSDPLELTGNHMVFKASNSSLQPVRAKNLQVGDTVQVSPVQDVKRVVTVTKISKVKREGVYMPLTASGTIVVNGVVSSCYVGLDEAVSSDVLELASQFGMTENNLLHWWLAPYRMLCMGVSSSFGNTYSPAEDWEQGIHPWLVTGRNAAGYIHQRSAMVQFWMCAFPLFLVFGLLVGLESLVGPALAPAVLVVGVWIFGKKYFKQNATAAWAAKKPAVSLGSKKTGKTC